MDNETFYTIYERLENRNNSKEDFWLRTSVEFGYPTPESCRSAYRRKRKKLNLVRQDNNTSVPKNCAKILIMDIETTPLLAFSWGLWEQNIQTSAIVQDWHMLSHASKWLFEEKVNSDVLTSKEARNHDDKRIAKSMWEMLDKAEVVIAHNAKKFDTRRLNTRFLLNGMSPPSHYHVIDTLSVAKRMFNFSSNKLDYINEMLGLPVKTHTGFELWRDCFYGESEALQEMVEYNRNDVTILEEMYVEIRPWILNHPNVAIYSDSLSKMCKNCGSENLTWGGYYTTPLGKYQAFRCECGAIGRSKTNELPRSKRDSLLR